MAWQFQKHYTRDEARYLLPQIRQWLTRSSELQAEVQEVEERLGGLMAPGSDLGGEVVNTWVRTLVDLEEVLLEFQRREIQVKDHTNQILAYAITLGFFGTLAYILKFGLPLENEAAKNVLLMLVGSLGTAWTTGVVGYYFGSSSGSDRKTDLLGRLQGASPQEDK